jgi:hypothetical protein
VKITDKEAAAMFRADAIAAGIPEWMTPNDIANALHDWFESVPENPRDELWLEVSDLLEYDGTEDFYQRRAHACRGVLIRQQLRPVAHC